MLRIGVVAALAALALPAGIARADVTLSGFSVTPSTTAAGGHPDVVVHEGFGYGGSSSDSVKDTVLHFPPGLLGNPQATAKCTMAAFHADTCPANTQVGTTTVTAVIPPVPVPMPQQGKIYNLVPDATHPAVLGIVVSTTTGKIFLTSPVSLRTSGDFGIDSPVDNTPHTIGPLNTQIQITAVDLTLLGKPAGAQAPFMTNPTSCKPATTTFDADSWESPTKIASGSSTFTPTACDRLPFAPHVSATVGAPGATAKGSRVPFVATITQAPGEAAQLSAAVTLPASVSPGLDSVSELCSAAQLAAAACPAGARVGTAMIASPLLATSVQGPAFALAKKGLPGVGVEFGGVLPFVLGGSTALVQGARLENVFSGLPDVPLTTFSLAIDGGPHGLLEANRDLCSGPAPTVEGAFTGQNGAATSVTAPVSVQGCGPARPAKAKRPRARVLARGFGGRHPRLSITVRRGSKRLRTAVVTLPRGIRARRGVSAKGASFKLHRKSIRISRHGSRITLRLPKRGASRVTVRLSGHSLRVSRSVKRKLHRHRSIRMRLTIRTTDTSHHRATLRPRFRAPR